MVLPIIHFRAYISSQESILIPYSTSNMKGHLMKTNLFTLILGLLTFTAANAQETVVVQRPGIFTDLANATGVVLSLPFTIAEGVVVGAVEATGSLIQGSTEVIIVPKATPVSVPVVVATPQPVRPSTTIITADGDGTITTVTRNVSAYELGPVILTPVSPSHRVGAGLHVNPYIFRYR
jgi:hypothetical protein